VTRGILCGAPPEGSGLEVCRGRRGSGTQVASEELTGSYSDMCNASPAAKANLNANFKKEDLSNAAMGSPSGVLLV
jgi:hypothetical protein